MEWTDFLELGGGFLLVILGGVGTLIIIWLYFYLYKVVSRTIKDKFVKWVVYIIVALIGIRTKTIPLLIFYYLWEKYVEYKEKKALAKEPYKRDDNEQKSLPQNNTEI